MNESFAYLGLRADADERAVKRAYAQRLKLIRPEDDPAGFQALHEHYRRALDQARQQAQAALGGASVHETASALQEHPELRDGSVLDTDARDATASPSSKAPLADTAPPAFDLDAFVQDLFAKIGDDDAGKLGDWLRSIDAFWSLALKNHAGHVALQNLANHRVAVRTELFDVVLAFFDFDNALSGYDQFAIQRLREALQLQYEMQDAHRDVLVQRMKRVGNFDSSQTRNMLAALLRPFEPWRAYRRALPPAMPGSMMRFIHILSHGQPDLLCPPFDLQHLRFWYAAADRSRFMRPRVLLGYLRILVLVVPTAAVLCALALAMPPSPPKRFEQALGVLAFFAWTLAGLTTLWTAWLAWLAALRWQAGPENGRLDRNGLARTLFVPAVAAAAGAACAYSAQAWLLNAGLVAAIVIAALAIVRFWRRAGLKFPRINLWGLGWLAFVVLGNLGRVVFEQIPQAVSGDGPPLLPDSGEWQARAFIGIVLAGVSGLAWLVDMIRQRSRFYRPSSAPSRQAAQ